MFIIARIASIFVSATAVHIYDFYIFTVIENIICCLRRYLFASHPLNYSIFCLNLYHLQTLQLFRWKRVFKVHFIFRTLLKLGSLLWSRNIPLLFCRSYGFIGCMRIVLQEHCGKNHNIFFCGIMLHLYLWD